MPEPTSRLPKLFGDRFICPRCNSFADQTWHDLKYSARTARGTGWVDAHDLDQSPYWGSDEAENVENRSEESQWRMSECASCQHRAVWRHDALIYPVSSPAPTPSVDMPDEVRPLYEESGAVAAVSPRAGAALARATLERLLKLLDPDAPKRLQLDDYIVRVLPRVNVATGKLLTLIRHVGNKSLHVEDVPDEAIVLLLSDEDADILGVLFQTINDVVEELITRPRQADALYEAVPASVRSAAEAKAARAAQPG